MAKELTPRQQEIKALTEQGMNAVRRSRRSWASRRTGCTSTSARSGAARRSRPAPPAGGATGYGGRQSRTRSPDPDPESPAPTPAAPATAEELLRQEIDGAQAGVSDLKGQIKGHQDEIARPRRRSRR
jgi:hypothetical protein